MKWIECTIKTKHEDVELLCAELLDFGIDAVEIVDPKEAILYLQSKPKDWDYIEPSLLINNGGASIRFFITKDNTVLPTLKKVYSNIITNVVEDSWTHAWKEHYKPFKIGQNIVIVPVWEDYKKQSNDIIFKINPGSAFGTGQHQSTALCIQLLEANIKQKAKVLDIGSGSGILSIISLLLGSVSALAIDIDYEAVRVSKENAILNNIQKQYSVLQGDVLTDDDILNDIGYGYDIILSNIIADAIMPLAAKIKNKLTNNGIFIAGGIIKDRADEVMHSLKASGYDIVSKVWQDEWVAVLAKLNNYA